jgi:hypothetical protein
MKAAAVLLAIALAVISPLASMAQQKDQSKKLHTPAYLLPFN